MVRKGYKGFPGGTKGYYGLQGLKRVAGLYKALHRVTRSSRGFQRVT